MAKYTTLTLAALLLVIGGPMRATAGVITFTSRAAFDAEGITNPPSKFDTVTLNSGGFNTPGDPFTQDNITYTSGANIIAGTTSSYAPLRNLMTYNDWTPVKGTISGQFTMFGYDIGAFNFINPVTLEVKTNKGTITTILDDILPDASDALVFRGFVSNDPTEWFTEFSIVTAGTGSGAGITDVTLGHFEERGVVQPIPEPTTLALCGIATVTLAGYKGWRRRKQIVTA